MTPEEMKRAVARALTDSAEITSAMLAEVVEELAPTEPSRMKCLSIIRRAKARLLALAKALGR